MTAYNAITDYLTEKSGSGELTFGTCRPLSQCCTFRIGGNADFTVYPKTEAALLGVIAAAREYGIRFNVFGNGSNVLFDDNGYRGLIIFTTQLKCIRLDENTVSADSGVSLTQLAVDMQKHGLSGLEFAYGIPGSVGGAVFMNAGAFDGEISKVCVSSRAYDITSGEIKSYDLNSHGFGYRESVFMSNGAIILSSSFRLTEADSAGIKSVMDSFMTRRLEKQPLDYPSAGSVFKRCNGYFTARLIEEAGLKGAREGDAQVSEKHAGFIVNLGNATSDDVLKLIVCIRERISERFGLDITPEIRYIPER